MTIMVPSPSSSFSSSRTESFFQILASQYHLSPESRLSQALVYGISEATASISNILFNHTHQSYIGTTNASGDSQLDIDVKCDQAVFQALYETNEKSNDHVFRYAISEETPVETEIPPPSTNPKTVENGNLQETHSMQEQKDFEANGFLISFDPLDGSSIIDANFTVGSIFGVWPCAHPTTHLPSSPSQILHRTGREQCASAIALYGPRTTLLIALPFTSVDLPPSSSSSGLVFEVTLVQKDPTNPQGEEWVLTRSNIQISSNIGRIFAPGNLRAIQDNPAYAAMVQYWIQNGYTLRYTGGMVPDVYHILVKGKGIFSNISSQQHKAKIRMIYEAAPIALLIECAGGISMADDMVANGTILSTCTDMTTKMSHSGQSVLDIRIDHYDQRTGLCVGGKDEVDLFNQFLWQGRRE